jgi:hypothetical protein
MITAVEPQNTPKVSRKRRNMSRLARHLNGIEIRAHNVVGASAFHFGFGALAKCDGAAQARLQS